MSDEFLLGPRFEKLQTCENRWTSCYQSCLQDTYLQNGLRCVDSKHMVVFDFVSGTPDSDPPETLDKKVGSKVFKGKPYLWICKLILLACFVCIVAVSWRPGERGIRTHRNHSEVPFKSYKITRSYEYPLYPRIFWQVCSDLVTAGALLNCWGGAICLKICFIVIDSFDSHWITMTIIEIISLYFYRCTVQWLTISSTMAWIKLV